MSNRLGWVVGALIAVLVALTGVAVHSLVLLGSVLLASIVAIGGITARTMPEVLAAGADAVAMIGEIVRAQDVSAKVRAVLRVP